VARVVPEDENGNGTPGLAGDDELAAEDVELTAEDVELTAEDVEVTAEDVLEQREEAPADE
jgi:hypothetical protein